MFRQQLDYRKEKLKTECEKANTSLGLLLENVDLLAGIEMPGGSSPNVIMSNCKFQMEILRHIDNFSYPVIEFNVYVETLVSQALEFLGSANLNKPNRNPNVKTEITIPNLNFEKSDDVILNVHKAEETNTKVDDTYICNAVESPADLVEVVPDISIAPASLLDEKDEIIEEDINDEISTEDGISNKTCIEIDLNFDNDIKPSEINQINNDLICKIDVANLNEDCSITRRGDLKQEEDIPVLDLPDQPILEIDEDFDTLMTHVESPSQFYVTCECAEFDKLQLEMTNHFNKKENKYVTTKEKLTSNNQRYFACYHEFSWLRGVLTDVLKFDDFHIEVFLLDVGHRGKIMDCRDVQPLPEKFFTLPPQAYLCHLNGVQPLPKDNHEWSKQAIDVMKNLCGTSCIVNVTNNVNDSLEVCLMTMESIAVNVQLIQEDLAILLDGSEQDDKMTLQSDCQPSTLDSFLSTQSIVPKSPRAEQIKKSFQIGEEVICYFMYVESPSRFFIVLQENQHEILAMMEDMMNVCNTINNSYLSKKEILDSRNRYYACPFEEEWVRGSISDRLNFESEHVEMFLIDVGCKIRFHFSEIRFLDKIFYTLEPQAHACHLYLIEPPNESDGVWSSKALEYVLQLQDTLGSITIATIDDQSLGVFLKKYDGTDFNQKMVENRMAVVQSIIGYESHPDSPTEFPEMAPTNDLFSDFVANLQGFSSDFDLELCNNYTGPPKTTCYKGSKCKKLHQLPNKDGWTSKKIPEVSLPQNLLVFPASNTMVNINITAIKSCNTFYGHILYYNEKEKTYTNTHSSTKTRQPKELTDLMDLMNSERVVKSLVHLTSAPCSGMLLLCFVANQEKWFRSMVVDHAGESLATVFLVDYGIEHTVEFKHMRKLDGVYAQMPFQAFELSLANAECECIRFGKCYDGMSALFNMTANKGTTGFVVSSNTERVEVVLYNEDFTDIGGALCEMGLLKAVEYKMQDSKDNEFNENINNVYSKYHKRKQQSHQEILYGVKKCGIIPSAP